MFCMYCGTKNNDGNRFCVKCGQPLEQLEPEPQEEPAFWQDSAARPEQAAPAETIAQDAAFDQEGSGSCDAGAGWTDPVTGEADWGLDQPEPSEPRWAPTPDSQLSEAGSQEAVIVRNGTWSSADLAAPPPAPVPAAPGKTRTGLVIALCLATALAGAGALCFLLFRERLVGAQPPAFAIFIPIALGGAALIFAAAAALVILSSRREASQLQPDWSAGPGPAVPSASDPQVQDAWSAEDFASDASYTEEPAPFDAGAFSADPGEAPTGILATLTDTGRTDPPIPITLDGNGVVIGRLPEQCDVPLSYEPSVSKRHCRLYADGGSIYVEDLGGRNGTYLNGALIAGPTPVRSGDLLKLGRLKLRLDIG